MALSNSERYFHNQYSDYFGESDVITSIGELSSNFKLRLENFVQDVLQHLEEKYASNEIDRRDNCVYTGLSGIAFIYIRLYELGVKTDGLQIALKYLENFLRRIRVSYVTFLIGETGPLSIACYLLYKLNRQNEYQKCLEYLLSVEKEALKSSTPDELLYGRVGYLYCLLWINKKIHTKPIPKVVIENIVKSVENSGLKHPRKTKDLPLMYEWYNEQYLGAAHGLSGIVTMLLKSECADKTLMKQEIEGLCKLKYPSGNFPTVLPPETKELLHWCHGCPGFTYMFIEAYKKIGDENYLVEAKKCGDQIWEKGILKKGYGLCHGTAGNAYSLLAIYQATKDLKYLHRAAKFAEFCLSYGNHNCRIPDTPYSLFEGMGGTLYYLVELLYDSENAKFPCFDDV